jgi:iron complex outermembrane receptor protein
LVQRARWRQRAAGATLAVAALAPPARAWAQAQLGTVRVEAPRVDDDPAASESTAFVTVVRVDTPSARAASVADLVEREAGVRVRAAGGLGSFTSVSIRGADAGEVAVFLDGVPLNRASAAGVDLSQIPADAIERVEIHRGMPPPELGGAALGGAINLITRKSGGGWRSSVGGGSFGARSLGVGYGFAGRALHGDAQVAYRGANGDFSYYDYNGTLLDPSDDRTSVRQNNGFDQLAGDVELGGAAGERGRFSLGAHGFLKHQGVPARGSEGAETHDASFTLGRVLVDGALERRGVAGRGIDLRLGAHALFERGAFDNHEGELVGSFKAARTDGETLDVGGEARVSAAVGTSDLFTALFALSWERFVPHDLLAPESTPAPSSRLRAALLVADDIRVRGDRLAVTPALRLDVYSSQTQTALSTTGPQAMGADRTDAFLSPQLGVRWRPISWLTLKASGGRHVRLPTTLELFGDGAFFLGRPALKPETAWSGDAGGALEGKAGPIAGFLELAVFGRRVADYIALVSSGHALAASNVGDQAFAGVEARGRVRLLDRFALVGGYTWIHATTSSSDTVANAVGKSLPNVPEHKLDVRAEVTLGPVSAFYELAWNSDVWLDAQNVEGHVIPGRALHALGGRIGPSRQVPFALTVEVRNLADLRVVQLPLGGTIHRGETAPYPLVDFYDYPLPGRAVYLTLAWLPGSR